MNTYNIYEKKELLHQFKADYFYIDDDGVAYFFNYITPPGFDPNDPDLEREVELLHTVPNGTQYIITKMN